MLNRTEEALPLLRSGFCDLVRRIALLPTVDDLSMTTNGVLLPKFVSKLADGGLDRITVSLDSRVKPHSAALIRTVRVKSA
jgi:cyclic pyranopterin phosphate synthase